MDQLKILLDSIDGKCDWVGLRSYSEKNNFSMARNGQFSKTAISYDKGIMVEVLNNGQIAYGATSNITPAGVQEAFERALALANMTAANKVCHFDETVRPIEEGNYTSQFEASLKNISVSEIQNRLIELSKCLKVNDKIKETSAWAILTETEIDFISSSGSRNKQKFQMVTRDMSATAIVNGEAQKRSLGMQGRQWGAESLNLEHLKLEAKRIGEEAIKLLDAPDCPSGKKSLILAPDQLYLQVHESIGHPLELDRILGDERNYAGWSFVNLNDFGNLKYGPEILNVSFDPHFAGEMASYHFDDNGFKAQKEYLIKEGVLQRAIGGLESQFRSGIPGVACARSSSWNRAPMDRMANINIEPGASTMQDMVSSIEDGILMRTNRSWSIDDYRNKFQFGCEYGELIKDGEIKGLVKNPNYRGSTIDFWGGLDMVGNEDTFEVWGSPYCGKGEPNQIIRVGHAIPYCKFNNIEVFGGAK